MQQEPVKIKIYKQKNYIIYILLSLLLALYVPALIIFLILLIPVFLIVLFIVKRIKSKQIYASEMLITEDEINIVYKSNNKIVEIKKLKKNDISAFNVTVEQIKNSIDVNVNIEVKNGETIDFKSDVNPRPLPYSFVLDLLDYKNEIPNFNYNEEEIVIPKEDDSKKTEIRQRILIILFFILVPYKFISDFVDHPKLYLMMARYHYAKEDYNKTIKDSKKTISLLSSLKYNTLGQYDRSDREDIGREVYEYISKSYEQNKDYYDLREFCTSNIDKAFDDYTYIYLLRGIAEYHLGEYVSALQDLERHKDIINNHMVEYEQSDLDELNKLIEDTRENIKSSNNKDNSKEAVVEDNEKTVTKDNNNLFESQEDSKKNYDYF